MSHNQAVAMALELRRSGMSLKDAAKRASLRTGQPKNAIYDAICG